MSPHRAAAPSYPVSIFIAGEYGRCVQLCEDYCTAVGLCVTITRTHYAYSFGGEEGMIIGLINYPRFPKEPAQIRAHAEELALSLLGHLRFPPQESCTIHTPEQTYWISFREGDLKPS